MTIYVQSDLDALDRMIASGVLSTTYDGKRIEYRSMADLRAARAMVAASLAASAGTLPDRNLTPTYSKGV